jgi:hypothetical protein
MIKPKEKIIVQKDKKKITIKRMRIKSEKTKINNFWIEGLN